jgi:hypothetical protein
MSVLNSEDNRQEVSMGTAQSIGEATDGVLAALVAGLEIEFGRGAVAALAHHIMAAEEADFLWEMRCDERWLGGYESLDEEQIELDRVAIIGRCDGRWFVATMVVNGNGRVQDVLGRRDYRDQSEARNAFMEAR